MNFKKFKTIFIVFVAIFFSTSFFVWKGIVKNAQAVNLKDVTNAWISGYDGNGYSMSWEWSLDPVGQIPEGYAVTVSYRKKDYGGYIYLDNGNTDTTSITFYSLNLESCGCSYVEYKITIGSIYGGDVLETYTKFPVSCSTNCQHSSFTGVGAYALSTNSFRLTWSDAVIHPSPYPNWGTGIAYIGTSHITDNTNVATAEHVDLTSGLSSNTQYRLTVRNEYDAHYPGNDMWEYGTESEIGNKYTKIESPTTVSCSNATANSLTVAVTNSLSNLTSGSSGVKMTTISPSGTFSNSYQQSQTWTVSGLAADTSYSFKFRSRNGDSIENSETGYLTDGTCKTTSGGSTCGDNIYGQEMDYSQALCGAAPWSLTGGNSWSVCWRDTMCCGDDSNESFRICQQGSGIDYSVCTGLTKACCVYNTNCVNNNTCYASGNNIGGSSPNGHDNTYICDGQMGIGFWYDCDFSGLGSPKAYAGEGGVGEYDENLGSVGAWQCCADDNNEYLKTNVQTGVTRCCSSNDDVVDASGNCSSGGAPPPPPPGEDETPPVVSSFTVDGHASSYTSCDTSPTVAWTVTDDVGLQRVEVWRNNNGGGWAVVHSENISGTSHSGSWTDSLTMDSATETYEYGIHVIDTSDNQGTEAATITATLHWSSIPVNNLHFTDITQTSLRIEWDYGEYQHEKTNIYRDSTGEGIGYMPAPNTYYNDIGPLDCGTDYTYWAETWNSYCGAAPKVMGTTRTSDCTEPPPADSELPVVTVFNVNGQTSDFCTTTLALAINWTVTDSGGSGLSQVEVWKKIDSGSWAEVTDCRMGGLSGNGPISGSCAETVTCGHIYTYGIHVKDKNGNLGTETTSGKTPIAATVNCDTCAGADLDANPVANFTMCKYSGSNIVKFTNTSLRADGGAKEGDWTYSWDFDSRDGLQTNSTEENPTHDYTGVVEGVSTVAEEIIQAEDKINEKNILENKEETKGFFGPLVDGFKFLWQQIENLWQKVFKPAKAAAGWWNGNWTKRIAITFNNTGRGALTDVPILVALTNSITNFDDIKAAGADIRFVDADNTTELDYEIEKWDDTGKTAKIWVKVPQIDAGSTTDKIYMYYNNGSVSDAQNAAGVWSNNYAGVYHLKETSGKHYDSTSNNNDSIQISVASQGNAAGKINGADEFAPEWVEDHWESDKIMVDDDNSLDLTSGVTLEAWAKMDNTGRQRIISKGNEAYVMRHEGWGILHGYVIVPGVGSYAAVSQVNTLNAGEWYYATFTWNKTTDSGKLKLYKNGSEVAYIGQATYTGNLATNNVDLYLGTHLSENEGFDGILDELRISNVARSADWISFQYCSMMQTCLTYGSSEVSGLYVTLTVTGNGTSDSEAKLMDLDELSNCPVTSYNLTTVTATNCTTIELDWDSASPAPSVGYTVYRATGAAGPWSAIGTTNSETTAYSDHNESFVEDTTYYYYISTNPDGINNSRTTPTSCTGGVGTSGTKCPKADTLPICPVEGLDITRSCGKLTLTWTDEEDTEEYEVKRCLGTGCSNYVVVNLNYTCASGACTLIDDEVTTVNTVNPPAGSYYCYKIRRQNEDDEWSDLSSAQCDFSYCYRGTQWREK